MTIQRGRITIVGDNAPNGFEVVPPGGHGTPQLRRWIPNAYEAAVAAILNRIAIVPIGALVLRSLRQPVQIEPWQNLTVRNASADAAASDWPTYNRGYRAGAPMVQCGGGDVPYIPSQVGTGEGTNARVHFTPSQWMSGTTGLSGSARHGGPAGPGGAEDEVLLHELFHALRITMGLGDCRQLTGRMQRYNDRSEFYAIIVENIYSSQSGRQPRTGHHGYSPMLNQNTYLTNSRHEWMIRLFCESQPLFTIDAARQRGRFNPFREHYINNGILNAGEYDI